MTVWTPGSRSTGLSSPRHAAAGRLVCLHSLPGANSFQGIAKDAQQIRQLDLSRSEDEIGLYTWSGLPISSFEVRVRDTPELTRQWPREAIVAIGWGDDDEFVAATDQGAVRCYRLDGEYTEFQVGQAAAAGGVQSCRIHGSGLVTLMADGQFVTTQSFTSARSYALAKIPDGRKATSWDMVRLDSGLGKSVEVYAAIGGSIYVVDLDTATEHKLGADELFRVSTSPNGKIIAIMRRNGSLFVYDTDFSHLFCDVDLGITPDDGTQLGWCGNDCIAIVHRGILTMVGPDGQTMRLYVHPLTLVVTEFDSLRILSPTGCDMLRRLPYGLNETLGIGSTAPSAILLDCVDLVDRRSVQAEENIRIIKDHLLEAIDDCIRSARNELSAVWQNKLLKAASYGKYYLEAYDSDTFVETCETLRVINQMWSRDVGMPITYAQYQDLSHDTIIRRLMDRNLFLLAFKIAEYLKLPTAVVFERWAIAKAKSSTLLSDDELYECIVQMTRGQKTVPYDSIASEVYRLGRSSLAPRLLDLETRKLHKVSLLLDMGEADLALENAVASGDPSAILKVCTYIKETKSLPDYMTTLDSQPVAKELIEGYASKYDLSLFKVMCFRDDHPNRMAEVLLAQSCGLDDTSKRVPLLQAASKYYKEMKATSFESTAVADELKLLETQRALSDETGIDLEGCTLYETVFRLLQNNKHAKATKVRQTYRMTEKQFWWIQLRAMLASRDWYGLEQWTDKARDSPIGFQPFVRGCAQAGNGRLAAKYIARCTDASVEERVKLWLLIPDVDAAVSEAVRHKDLDLLNFLKTRALTPHQKANIERYLGEL